MGFWLDRMDDVWELDCILDEEDWNVVADNVPVSLGRIHLDRETTHIPNGIGTAFTALNGGESSKDRSLSRRVGENPGSREVADAFLHPERAKSANSTGMHHSFGDALVIKTHYLNHQMCLA